MLAQPASALPVEPGQPRHSRQAEPHQLRGRRFSPKPLVSSFPHLAPPGSDGAASSQEPEAKPRLRLNPRARRTASWEDGEDSFGLLDFGIPPLHLCVCGASASEPNQPSVLTAQDRPGWLDLDRELGCSPDRKVRAARVQAGLPCTGLVVAILSRGSVGCPLASLTHSRHRLTPRCDVEGVSRHCHVSPGDTRPSQEALPGWHGVTRSRSGSAHVTWRESSVLRTWQDAVGWRSGARERSGERLPLTCKQGVP